MDLTTLWQGRTACHRLCPVPTGLAQHPAMITPRVPGIREIVVTIAPPGPGLDLAPRAVAGELAVPALDLPGPARPAVGRGRHRGPHRPWWRFR